MKGRKHCGCLNRGAPGHAGKKRAGPRSSGFNPARSDSLNGEAARALPGFHPSPGPTHCSLGCPRNQQSPTHRARHRTLLSQPTTCSVTSIGSASTMTVHNAHLTSFSLCISLTHMMKEQEEGCEVSRLDCANHRLVLIYCLDSLLGM